MDLPQIGQESEDIGNGRQLVPIQVDVAQAWPINVFPSEPFRVEERREVVLGQVE